MPQARRVASDLAPAPTAAGAAKDDPRSRAVLGVVWLSVVLAVLLWVALLWIGPLRSIDVLHGRVPLFDFGIYYTQARQIWHTPPVLLDRWYYPPFAALCFSPLGALSERAATLVWIALQAALVVCLVRFCASALERLAPATRWSAALGLTLSSLPVIHNLGAGQISLLVLVLSLYGLAQPRGAAWLAVAAGLKIYPALYAMGHLLRRRFRYLASAGAWGVALALVLPWLVFGSEAHGLLWRRTLTVVSRGTGPLTDEAQTVRSVLGRLFHTRSVFDDAPNPLLLELPYGMVVAISAIAAVLLVAYTLRRTYTRAVSDPLTIAATILALAMVLEPGWIHGFVVLPYAQAVLLGRARDRADLALCAASVVLSSAPLTAVLLWPDLADSLYVSGVTLWASAAALAGLWRLPLGAARADR